MAKILIIEDDPFLIKLYTDILTTAGYQIEVSENGKEGQEKIEKGKPDLVLLDIMLPKINGLDMLEELRAKEEFKDLKVIVITNLASEADQARAANLGALKYLIKTAYDPNQIVDIIKEYLDPK